MHHYLLMSNVILDEGPKDVVNSGQQWFRVVYDDLGISLALIDRSSTFSVSIDNQICFNQHVYSKNVTNIVIAVN